VFSSINEPRIVINREVRAWSKVNQDSFRAAILESELCSVDYYAVTADDYFELYESVLTRLADRFAPVKRVIIRRQRLALWMSSATTQEVANAGASLPADTASRRSSSLGRS